MLGIVMLEMSVAAFVGKSIHRSSDSSGTFRLRLDVEMENSKVYCCNYLQSYFYMAIKMNIKSMFTFFFVTLYLALYDCLQTLLLAKS